MRSGARGQPPGRRRPRKRRRPRHRGLIATGVAVALVGLWALRRGDPEPAPTSPARSGQSPARPGSAAPDLPDGPVANEAPAPRLEPAEPAAAEADDVVDETAPPGEPVPPEVTEVTETEVEREYRLRVVTTPGGAEVTLVGMKRRAPFSVTLTAEQLEKPIEVYAELEGHRPTRGWVSADSFEVVKDVLRDTLYLKLNPQR